MKQICEICRKESEDADICDNCIKRFCKKEEKGDCYYCLGYVCIDEANKVLCPICKREVPENKWEKHHLIPKSKKGKETILVCNCCGKVIHQLFSIKELEIKYNTFDSIMSNPKIKKWAEWAFKKPLDFTICMKEKKRK